LQHRAVGVVEGDDESLARRPLGDGGGQGPRSIAEPEEIPNLALEPRRRDREVARPVVGDGVVTKDQEVIGAANMAYATEPS
jgi:hypothetical protein